MTLENTGSPAGVSTGTELVPAASELAEFARAILDGRFQLSEDVDLGWERVMQNALAVMAAGAATDQHRSLTQAWLPQFGPAPVLGTPWWVSTEAAAWLGGVAAVAMELDEGHRRAGGHPAAQCFPAVIALSSSLRVPGALVRHALLIAYEITARVGAAMDLTPAVHPHGTSGAAGAAAGCAAVLGLDTQGIAHAILGGLSMPLAGAWSTVIQGGAIRDQWVGAANLNGLAAARMASAGLFPGVPPGLGALGALDGDVLCADLGKRWYICGNYTKRHSACAFLHAPADAAVELYPVLRNHHHDADIKQIFVEVSAQAARFAESAFTTRHGAWFSIPFAVASALTYGDVSYSRSDPDSWTPQFLALARLVQVRYTAELAQNGTSSRPARVTVVLKDGGELTASVSHPLGDQELTPFSSQQHELITNELLSASGLGINAAQLRAGITELENAPDCLDLFKALSASAQGAEK